LNVSCKLQVPENFSPDFDYRMYLAKDKIFYLCRNTELKKTGRNSGNILYGGIIKLKKFTERNINQVIPEPQAALANGLLFGGDNRLSEKIKENFSKTGMTHIVAVSGYNVTIIAEYLILLGIFLGLWRPQAFWFATAGIVLFVAMIGFPSSAVRAGVMGSLLLWAMKNGRLANSQNAIIFAGSIMLFLNPLLLRYDIGFQLSFLAALGLIMLSPFWEKFFIKKFRVLGLTEIFFMTLSAQIFVLPIIVYNFHVLSIVSIFLSAVLGFVFYPLSLLFAWLAYIPLKYEVEVINFLAGFDWASVEVNGFGSFFLILYYLLLIFLVSLFKRLEKNKKHDNLSENNL